MFAFRVWSVCTVRVVTVVAGALLHSTSLTAQRVSPAQLQAAAVSAVEGMISQNVLLMSGRASLCLGAYAPRGEREASPALFSVVADSLRGSYTRVSSLRACPKTYASMIVVVDSLGQPMNQRPASAVDPVYLILEPPVITASGAVLVRVHERTGMATRFWVCERGHCAAGNVVMMH